MRRKAAHGQRLVPTDAANVNARARAENQELIKGMGVCDGDEDHRENTILQRDNSQAVAEGGLLVLKRIEPGCLPHPRDN